MTAPVPPNTGLDPEAPFTVKPSEGFGPDPAKSADAKAKTTRAGGKPFAGLGQNKKPRSGIRKLNDQDRDKIEGLYVAAGTLVVPFKPKVGKALKKSAPQCADAWMDVADQNDTIRRWILGLIEGGAWGKLIAAHAFILLAVLPENALPFGNIDPEMLEMLFDEMPDGPPDES